MVFTGCNKASCCHTHYYDINVSCMNSANNTIFNFLGGHVNMFLFDHHIVSVLKDVSPCFFQVIWVCNNCRKQQEILTKPGEWFTGPSGKPAGLGSAFSEPSVCQTLGDKKLRSHSQAPPGTLDPNRPSAPGTTPGIDARSRSEPPRDT